MTITRWKNPGNKSDSSSQWTFHRPMQTRHIVFLGLPRPRLPKLEPRVGTIEGLPGGLPRGFLAMGALAGISSSLSESDRSIARLFLLAVVKVEAGAVIVVMVVVRVLSPLRLEAVAPTILTFFPSMPGRVRMEFVG